MNRALPAITLSFLATTALAADGDAQAPNGVLPVPDYSGDLLHRSYLTGDWGGTRTDWANKGFQLDVDFTQYGQSIVAGGRDSDSHYGGHLDYLLHFDLMRMGLVPGAFVTVRGETRYGQSVNANAGPVLPVNTTAFFPLSDQLDDTVPIAVTDLNYTQFLSEHLGFVIGKIDTLDSDLNEFASGRGKSQFMHGSFLYDSVVALRLPYGTLGGGVFWIPNRHISVTATLVNTLDSSQSSGFEDFGHGMTATVEADTQYRLADLPGGMNLGGLYSFAQDFREIGGQLILSPGAGLSITNKSETWAVYWSAWQYLYVQDPNDKPINLRDGIADHRGIGLFARAGVADQDTNPVKWSASIGVGGLGMIPSRDNDQFGAGYYYTKFQETRISGLAGIDDNGQGLEAYYNVAITPAAHLTFDVQVQDTAFPNVDTAVILGLRLNLTF